MRIALCSTGQPPNTVTLRLSFGLCPLAQGTGAIMEQLGVNYKSPLGRETQRVVIAE